MFSCTCNNENHVVVHFEHSYANYRKGLVWDAPHKKKFCRIVLIDSYVFSSSWMYCLGTCQKWWSSRLNFSRLWKMGPDWFQI